MQRFENRWRFPNVCGAMDGKHVVVQCPKLTGSRYFSYQNLFGAFLFAVGDTDYSFLYLDVGTDGRVNDVFLFSRSRFGQALEPSAGSSL